jgi:hypothetical protein
MKEKRTYSLRIAADEFAKLAKFAEIYDLRMSQIVGKALRKWRRVSGGRVVICELRKNTTPRKGSVVRKFDIPEKLSANLRGCEIRNILSWYLRLYEVETVELKIPGNKKKEIVRYV